MVAGVPWWQWTLASLVVPIVVGLAAAYGGHLLSLRKSKYETRLLERRTTYEQLLPALFDLVDADARSVRLAYHDFRNQEAEDKARESDDEWVARRTSAMATIDSVLRRGELAASKSVLEALKGIGDRHMDIAARYRREELDYIDALEEDEESSRRALEEVRKAVSREV